MYVHYSLDHLLCPFYYMKLVHSQRIQKMDSVANEGLL